MLAPLCPGGAAAGVPTQQGEAHLPTAILDVWITNLGGRCAITNGSASTQPHAWTVAVPPPTAGDLSGPRADTGCTETTRGTRYRSTRFHVTRSMAGGMTASSHERVMGLGLDGIVGPQIWPQLIIQVQQGSNGDTVHAVQSQIHSRGDGAAQIAVDGILGPVTNDAVGRSRTCLARRLTGSSGRRPGTTWSMAISPHQIRRPPRTNCSAPGRRTIAIRRQERHARGGEPNLRTELRVGRRLVVRRLPGRRGFCCLRLAALQRSACSGSAY